MVTWQGREYPDWRAARADMVAGPTETAVAVLEESEAEVTPALPASSQVLTLQAERPARRESLPARHRPRTLAEVVGQAGVVSQLQALAAEPYPCALLLGGDTGVGKTACAWALAADLGCDIDAEPPEFGGVYSIASGDHNADALRELWPQLWTIPFASARGWKVLIVNEVEQLGGVVERLWLDRLEDLPPSTVVVFTTNALDSLPARFTDRCQVFEFQSGADALSGSARALAASVWRAETGADIPADVLGKVIERATRAGRLSFRRVVQALVPLIAAKGKVCNVEER